MGLAENLRGVTDRVNSATLAAGRQIGDVRLLAASKRTDAQGILETIALGHTLFGENRAQALRDKFDVVHPVSPDAEWHFIGHLQKNKVKYIVGRASMIHSVDSFDLVKAVTARVQQQRRTGVTVSPMQMLVQVKLGDEDSKTGTPVADVFPLCEAIMACPELELFGFMNIAPLGGSPEQWFAEMAELAELGRREGFPIQEMSMGMSGDMEIAIQYGATIVRVGSDIYWA